MGMEIRPREAKIIRRKLNDPMVALFMHEKRHRPSLLGIFEFAYQKGVEEPVFEDLLRAAGINGYKEADMGQSGTYGTNRGDFGGFTTPVRNRDDEIKAVIFIRHNVEWDDNSGGRDMICRITMAHELQHADDITNEKFVPGQIDNVKMEFDAHRAAVRLATENNDQDAVAFYLATLHQQLVAAPDIAMAAKQFIASAEYKRCREFVGEKFETWMQNCAGKSAGK